MKLISRTIRWILALCVVGILVVWNFPSLFSLNQQIVISQAVAMRGLGTAVLGAISVLALIYTVFKASKKTLAAVLTVALIATTAISGFILLSRGYEQSTKASANGQIRILSWNTDDDAVPAKTVAKLAIARNANVIALPEGRTRVAVRIQSILKARGHSFQVVPEVNSPSSLLVASSLGTYRYSKDSSQHILGGIVATPVDSSSPTLVVMHAQQPGVVATQAEQWRSHLNWYTRLCDRDNVILAGDMNATLDNLPSNQLGNCKSVALQRRAAAQGTWPTVLPAGFGAAIDQVWTSKQWSAESFAVEQDFDQAGSDHRPIFAVVTKK